jgi:hypothetical protein
MYGNNIKLSNLPGVSATALNQFPEDVCAEDWKNFKNIGFQLLTQGRKENV